MKWQTPPSSRGCDAELVDKAFEIACILVGLGEATLSNLNPFFNYTVSMQVFFCILQFYLPQNLVHFSSSIGHVVIYHIYIFHLHVIICNIMQYISYMV